ncbi:MAG: hypothetical protein A2V98_05905 [Planctomycetes bacterium RBG_16_64_12]|nr:MAG: hypothetical protein A2V98_05905 [Planctomycetes bacterium RBG_16_64_12]
MKRLVLFVEGDGDASAVPVLVRRLLTELNAWDSLFLDLNPFVVGGVNRLFKDDSGNWLRWLGAAAKRGSIGAVLVVLDGDLRRIRGKPFCAANVARELAQQSKRARAGDLFSVATVFACQEYESWLIAGVESLCGKPLKDGRPGVRPGTQPPGQNLELAPRDAKGWLKRVMESGYNPVRDSALLTEIVDFELIRNRPMRSFRRLESALSTIVGALRNQSHVVSPG